MTESSPYHVSIGRRAEKDIRKIKGRDRKLVLECIGTCIIKAANPRQQAKKLEGYSGLWRIRAGNYRIVFNINDVHRTVDIYLVAHRSNVYRQLGRMGF